MKPFIRFSTNLGLKLSSELESKIKMLPLRSEEGKLELEIAEEDEETLIVSAIFTPN